MLTGLLTNALVVARNALVVARSSATVAVLLKYVIIAAFAGAKLYVVR